MSSVISKSFTIDSDRLEKEQKSYETWLEERTENAYQENIKRAKKYVQLSKIHKNQN